MRSLGERLNLFRKANHIQCAEGKNYQRLLFVSVGSNERPLRLTRDSQLLNLRCGPGAAILPPEVSRIHMDFALRMDDGHMGARKFWREHLPRLKYHNPSVPMIVNRHDNNQSPPLMTIYLRNTPTTATESSAGGGEADATVAGGSEADSTTIQPASSRKNLSRAQPPAPHEKVVTIDMKNQRSSDILEYFYAKTRATPVQSTRDDITEMQQLESLRKQASIDRERVRSLRAEKKKEEDMLKRARAAGGMAEQEEA
ncbi:Ribosomal protein/NADH dehydrogenase domain protein [Moelleriella libera RCEF 2490]|uniref:Ribosomal protein/NADH dehydrogenase domain protein n=1 Tax=Moelleriella libera RCEF 2490 TaxID=1081109 RepID=A0A168E6F2_9HYPO|nr:Ribosomal protein/NADH dehydrogenase domain protein [Moelleriella libera RCEF 2490]